MKGDIKDILVREIMTKAPRTGTPMMTVQEAAMLMRSERIGSLVVVDGNDAVGILTERDILNKIVAEGRSAKMVKVHEVMSAPLIVVGPEDTVADAAKRMSRKRVRRLPVCENGVLVGMLTENDVIKLSPSLIEITREYSKILGRGQTDADDNTMGGYCESCRSYSDELRMLDGQLLCPECKEELE